MKLVDKVRLAPELLASFSTPSRVVQKAAVEVSPTSIRYIKNPHEEIQTIAVKRGGFIVFQLIVNPCHAAKIALITSNPVLISELEYDEDLIFFAIRQKPDVVAHLKKLPEWLQREAINRALPKEIIHVVKDPHPSLLREYLLRNPRNFRTFNRLPLEIELELLNSSDRLPTIMGIFGDMRSPSTAAQNYYVKMVLAKGKRENLLDGGVAWWTNVTNKIDESLKYSIIETIDWSLLKYSEIQQLRRIVVGSPELESALTLMI